MNVKIKNRLIGGAVLVSVLLIIIPMLNEPESQDEEIPAVDDTQIRMLFSDWDTPADMPEEMESSVPATSAPQEKMESSVSAPSAPQEEMESSVSTPSALQKEGSCRVRVGVFARPESILRRLREDQYEVDVIPWGDNAEKTPLYAVYVGGAMDCDEAHSIGAELYEVYQEQPLIEYNSSPLPDRKTTP